MLENPRSSRIKELAALQQKSARSETGRFLVEGPAAVSEALRYAPELVEEIFFTPEAGIKHQELLSAAQDAGLTPEWVNEEVAKRLSDTVTPQGVIAVAKQSPVRFRDILGEPIKTVAILHNVRDPGNLGTIIRVADAAGVDAILLTGRTVDVHSPKVIRSSTGSIFHIPVAVNLDLFEVVSQLRSEGVRIIAADISGDDLLEWQRQNSLAEPTAWLFGNEASGLTDDELEQADLALRVPIYGLAESMNLATAASVCLYASAFANNQ